MSEPIARPVFFEGQILAAADLEATVEHARGESARDRRSLHTPGIAAGLALTGRERTSGGTKFQEVTLSAGVAIDSTGRQVVLAADTRLDETLFDDLRVEVTNAAEPPWYPVFVRGVDAQAPAQPAAAGSCGTTGPTRVTESAEITFGSPGQELDFDAGEPPEPADGPGDPRGTLVLVGYVQWQAPHFTAVALQPPGKVRPRFAGVLADEVVARAGTLSLRSGEGTDKPALVLDQADGGSLVFGLQNAGGSVIPALTVTSKGDVIAAGVFSSALASGTLVQSGVISDGLLVPLPAKVTEEQVESGQVKLHIHLTPRYQGPDPALPGLVLLPLECRAVGRRVICRFRWLNLTPPSPSIPLVNVTMGSPSTVSLPSFDMPPLTNVDLPGFCDYTVLAFAAPATGAGS